jgi:hypothetical protein
VCFATKLGEFTVRKHRIQQLDRAIAAHPDFRTVFGGVEEMARRGRGVQVKGVARGAWRKGC